MDSLTEIFEEHCWLPFVQSYKKSQPYDLSMRESDGTPSRIIWGEYDMQFRLAKLACAQFTDDWVHIEAPVPKSCGSRIDIVVTDPAPWRQLTKHKQLIYDLAVECKIVIASGEHRFGWPTIRKDARKLREHIDNNRIAAGVICVIDKAAENHDEQYEEIKRTTGVKILRCVDKDLCR